MSFTKPFVTLAPSASLASCTATDGALTYASPARDDSFDCAAKAFDGSGYDVRLSESTNSTFTAERREGHPQTWVTREFVTVTVVLGENDRRKLRMTVTALRYSSAFHGGPHPQSVNRTRPSDQTVADAQQALATCSGGENGSLLLL